MPHGMAVHCQIMAGRAGAPAAHNAGGCHRLTANQSVRELEVLATHQSPRLAMALMSAAADTGQP
jgi:hypothetical protein